MPTYENKNPEPPAETKADAETNRNVPWYLVFTTTQEADFAPSFTKTGATLYWKWPDGTYESSNAPTKTLAAGTKRVEVTSQDGWAGVTEVILAALNLTGVLPSYSSFTAMTTFVVTTNSFSGEIGRAHV
jgi:hypothetical protein